MVCEHGSGTGVISVAMIAAKAESKSAVPSVKHIVEPDTLAQDAVEPRQA